MTDTHLRQGLKGLLSEMAAPKLPEGVTKKRDANYASTHHISIDGKHIATIMGHKAEKHSYNQKEQYQGGGGTMYGKEYSIHAETPSWTEKGHDNKVHPDHHIDSFHHSYERDENGHYNYEKPTKTPVKLPHIHGSMEAAVEAIHRAHSLKNKFGSMTQEQRWQKAADLRGQLKDHETKSHKYATTVNNLNDLGHSDMAKTVHAAWETHKASKPNVSEHDINTLSHDAHQHAGSSYSYGTGHTHTEHQKLARKALGYS